MEHNPNDTCFAVWTLRSAVPAEKPEGDNVSIIRLHCGITKHVIETKTGYAMDTYAPIGDYCPRAGSVRIMYYNSKAPKAQRGRVYVQVLDPGRAKYVTEDKFELASTVEEVLTMQQRLAEHVRSVLTDTAEDGGIATPEGRTIIRSFNKPGYWPTRAEFRYPLGTVIDNAWRQK